MIRAGRYRAEIERDGYLVIDTATGATISRTYLPGSTPRIVRREALAHVTRLDWQAQTEAA